MLFRSVIGFLIGIALVMLLPDSMLDGQMRLTLGPGLLLDPDTMRQSLLIGLARLDLSTLWVTVLIGLGIKTTGGISTGKAISAGAIVWVLGGVLIVGLVFAGEVLQGVK